MNNLPSQQEQDEHWMRQALDLARQAEALGEVPVGALVICDNQVVSSAYNKKESLPSALGHAEILAIESACQALGRWRLTGCTLYVTLEPCTMCAGAIVQARFDRVVYAATDPKAGAVESLYQVLTDSRLNHQPVVQKDVLQAEASAMLSSFFKKLRQREPKR